MEEEKQKSEKTPIVKKTKVKIEQEKLKENIKIVMKKRQENFTKFTKG